MKLSKLYIIAASAAVCAGVSACDDVTDPKFQKPDPAGFRIEAPAMQDAYMKLTPEGTFEVSVNGQPDYGFTAVTQYRIEVALTEDFKTAITLQPIGTGTKPQMTFNDADLAAALCEFDGVTKYDEYVDKGEQKVYIRGVAYIDGVPDSYVVSSNVTSLNRVQGYNIFPEVVLPGKIYVIGNYVGAWIGPDAANATALEQYALYEKAEEAGSQIYYGTVDFQPTNLAEGCIFRFYKALEGWVPANSLGCAGGTNTDTPVEFPGFGAGSTLEHQLAVTNDSFKFNNYTGKLHFVVDVKKMTVTITAVAD